VALVELIHQGDKAPGFALQLRVITGTSNNITVWNRRESAM
jgi:hypothetical protein